MKPLARQYRQPGRLQRCCLRMPKSYLRSLVAGLFALLWSSNGTIAEPPVKLTAEDNLAMRYDRGAIGDNDDIIAIAPLSTAGLLPRFEVVSAKLIKPVDAPRQVTTYVGGPDIACRAAQRWLPAQLLRRRATTTINAYCEQDDCLRQAAATQATFLRLQAGAQEDIGAAAALRAYYSRIGIDQQLLLIDETEQLFSQQQIALQALIAKGFGTVDNDPSELSRRILELADQRIVARTSEAQLRSSLHLLTGNDFSFLDTGVEPFEVRAQPLDCDGLCDFAIAHRQDLQAWSYLTSRINEASAEMIAKSIAPMLGGIDLSLPQLCVLDLLLKRWKDNCLSCNIASEVATAYQLQRDLIERSVRSKCQTLLGNYERIELAEQIVASLEERITRLERLTDLGDSQAVKLFEARSQLSLAKSNALQRRIEGKLAEVDLAEAVGGLACRCCAGAPWLVINNVR